MDIFIIQEYDCIASTQTNGFKMNNAEAIKQKYGLQIH